MTRYLLIFLMTLISIFSVDVSYAKCGKYLDQDIQVILDKDRMIYQIPGIEVSVICPGESSVHDFVSGTTILNGRTFLQTNNLFQIGSETKSFIAAILLQLEAEGLLSIDDKIGKWLPKVNVVWQGITIKQLLNHTSGIPNYTDVLDEMLHSDNNIDPRKQWTSEELVNLIINKPLYFEPGKGWHYSNTNYVLAGMIIEVAIGKSVDEEIKTRLTKVLLLPDTYYLPNFYNAEIMARMAHGYSDRGYFSDEPKDITQTNPSWANAAGAIVSTSHDMAIWFKKLLNGSILPSKQMKELMSVVDESNGKSLSRTNKKMGYGLGIIHDMTTFGEETWWHSGATLGYSAFMVWLKCSNIVLTVNFNHVSSTNDLDKLVKGLVSYIQKLTGLKQCYLKFNRSNNIILDQK